MGFEIKTGLFDRIAKYYGMFFQYQTKKYKNALDTLTKELDLSDCREAIDIGCGTGALCHELRENGFLVTGVDSSSKMLEVAGKKLKDEEVNLIHSDILAGLPFEDKSFDISFASFVAHGMKPEERKKLYQEMLRITRQRIIIYDYNEKRSILTNIIEWLEGGDYFNFIKTAGSEMKESFPNLRVLEMEGLASCYIIELR